MKEIEDKIRWLYDQWKGIIEVRYSNGKWSVNAASGGMTHHIHGTTSDTMVGAVDKAINKWINRSQEHPFIN